MLKTNGLTWKRVIGFTFDLRKCITGLKIKWLEKPQIFQVIFESIFLSLTLELDSTQNSKLVYPNSNILSRNFELFELSLITNFFINTQKRSKYSCILSTFLGFSSFSSFTWNDHVFFQFSSFFETHKDSTQDFEFWFKLELEIFFDIEFNVETRTRLDSKIWVENSHWLNLIKSLVCAFSAFQKF